MMIAAIKINTMFLLMKFTRHPDSIRSAVIIRRGMKMTDLFEKIKQLFVKEQKPKKPYMGNHEMCMKSIRAGVCPKDCERCAWSSLGKNRSEG